MVYSIRDLIYPYNSEEDTNKFIPYNNGRYKFWPWSQLWQNFSKGEGSLTLRQNKEILFFNANCFLTNIITRGQTFF